MKVTTLPAPDIDTLGTPVAWADAAGCLVGVNPAFARWMGISARRLQGQPLAAVMHWRASWKTVTATCCACIA